MKIVFLKSESCGPCKMMLPIAQQIAEEKGIELSVVSIETEEGREFADEVGARVVPTYALFDADEELLKVGMGAKTKEKFLEWVGNE